MEKSQINGMDFIIIGAGNVAVHMSEAIKNAGFVIRQVYSRTQKTAEALSQKLSVNYTNDIKNIAKNGDIYLLMLADDALENFLEQTDLSGKMLIHTSGSTAMDVLKKYSDQYGVIYPLQTFNKNIPLDFSNVPLFIEASDSETLSLIKTITNKLSNYVADADSTQRSYLHVAAVFACNFSNHMYTIAASLLEDNNISFEVLQPLIQQTTKKAIEHNPKDVQTGPAIRNDKNTLNKHMKMLEKRQGIQKIYRFVSEHILTGMNKTG